METMEVVPSQNVARAAVRGYRAPGVTCGDGELIAIVMLVAPVMGDGRVAGGNCRRMCATAPRLNEATEYELRDAISVGVSLRNGGKI